MSETQEPGVDRATLERQIRQAFRRRVSGHDLAADAMTKHLKVACSGVPTGLLPVLVVLIDHVPRTTGAGRNRPWPEYLEDLASPLRDTDVDDLTDAQFEQVAATFGTGVGDRLDTWPEYLQETVAGTRAASA